MVEKEEEVLGFVRKERLMLKAIDDVIYILIGVLVLTVFVFDILLKFLPIEAIIDESYVLAFQVVFVVVGIFIIIWATHRAWNSENGKYRRLIIYIFIYSIGVSLMIISFMILFYARNIMIVAFVNFVTAGILLAGGVMNEYLDIKRNEYN